jgi:putative effector of murein hydrolase LrgA (UPF0299 family)
LCNRSHAANAIDGAAALEDVQVELKSAIASFRLATFSVTMFCGPLLDVMLKNLQKVVDVREQVGQFTLAYMKMVAFPCFVIVAQYTDAIADQCQTLFVAMLASWLKPWQLP